MGRRAPVNVVAVEVAGVVANGLASAFVEGDGPRRMREVGGDGRLLSIAPSRVARGPFEHLQAAQGTPGDAGEGARTPLLPNQGVLHGHHVADGDRGEAAAIGTAGSGLTERGPVVP